ncbi:Gamma-D-Glutamyl-meso-Diaminopimelate Amidase [Cronobacter malonaticus 507]|nr:Gamma-D-Glutamyl-meso-Diaminopimelate Amidase [Cronobacter malonaticus 507]
MNTLTPLRPRARRGALPDDALRYGESALGAPLLWFPAPEARRRSARRA